MHREPWALSLGSFELKCFIHQTVSGGAVAPPPVQLSSPRLAAFDKASAAGALWPGESWRRRTGDPVFRSAFIDSNREARRYWVPPSRGMTRRMGGVASKTNNQEPYPYPPFTDRCCHPRLAQVRQPATPAAGCGSPFAPASPACEVVRPLARASSLAA